MSKNCSFSPAKNRLTLILVLDSFNMQGWHGPSLILFLPFSLIYDCSASLFILLEYAHTNFATCPVCKKIMFAVMNQIDFAISGETLLQFHEFVCITVRIIPPPTFGYLVFVITGDGWERGIKLRDVCMQGQILLTT